MISGMGTVFDVEVAPGSRSFVVEWQHQRANVRAGGNSDQVPFQRRMDEGWRKAAMAVRPRVKSEEPVWATCILENRDGELNNQLSKVAEGDGDGGGEDKGRG